MSGEADPLSRLVETEGLFGTDLLLARCGPAERQAGSPSLEDVREALGECTRCRLCESRTHVVFGEGSPTARLVFVGEGPGVNEDMEGRPFVGRAGQMLTAIIENVFFLKRDDVYIANIVKCRPPGNRTPLPDECATCLPFLVRQLEAIHPEFIVALGGIAAHNLLQTKDPISRLRGRFHALGDIRLMPTYHPAYLLRNPAEKRKVYEDMLVVREAMGIQPGKGSR